MLDKFARATAKHRAEHALVLSQAGVLAFLILDVHVESLALEEQLQIAIMLQHRVGSRLVEHALQSSTARLDKIGVEATDGLFFWGWRDNDTGVVVVQLVVEPEEVAVAARDCEFGVAVALGGGLGRDRVLGVGAGEIANLVRVAHRD